MDGCGDSERYHSERMVKPPIGVKPFFVAATDRISDLGHCIARQTDGTINPNIDFIREWATEILYQCDLIKRMEKTNE